MASFTDIKNARLRLADPPGVINIIQVATPANLPATPAQQTAYYVTSTGHYMTTSVLTGAVPANYSQAFLRVSDEYLTTLIDTYGIDAAVCKAFSMIIVQLGNQLVLIRNTTGTESTEYSDITSMMSYYRTMKKDCQDENNQQNNNSTGRFIKSKQPEIAGGNI